VTEQTPTPPLADGFQQQVATAPLAEEAAGPAPSTPLAEEHVVDPSPAGAPDGSAAMSTAGAPAASTELPSPVEVLAGLHDTIGEMQQDLAALRTGNAQPAADSLSGWADHVNAPLHKTLEGKAGMVTIAAGLASPFLVKYGVTPDQATQAGIGLATIAASVVFIARTWLKRAMAGHVAKA
jgi:hypothetical protein